MTKLIMPRCITYPGTHQLINHDVWDNHLPWLTKGDAYFLMWSEDLCCLPYRAANIIWDVNYKQDGQRLIEGWI